MDTVAEALISICPMCDAVMKGETAKAGPLRLFATDPCRPDPDEVS